MSLSVKVSGVWKTVTVLSTKVGGVWKTVPEASVRVGGAWKKFKTAGGAYAFVETFEGAQADSNSEVGYDNTGWGSSGAAYVTPRDTLAPYHGTYSLRLEAYGSVIHDVMPTDLDTVELSFAFRVPGFTTNAPICEIRDASDNVLAEVRMRAGPKLRVMNTGGTSGADIGPDNTTGTNFATDTWYRAWVKYSKGTGVNAIAELRVSANNTRPAATNSSSTDGTSTAQADAFVLVAGEMAGFLFDDVVQDVSVGSNPVP